MLGLRRYVYFYHQLLFSIARHGKDFGREADHCLTFTIDARSRAVDDAIFILNAYQINRLATAQAAFFQSYRRNFRFIADSLQFEYANSITGGGQWKQARRGRYRRQAYH